MDSLILKLGDPFVYSSGDIFVCSPQFRAVNQKVNRIVSRNGIAIGPESQLAGLNAYSIYQRIALLLRVELFVSVSMSVKEESFQRSVPKKQIFQ